MKLPLETKRTNYDRISAIWRESAPFFMNDRAILIHRPKSVDIYNIHGYPHIAVRLFCGNGVNTKKGIYFIESPPSDRLLCEICEMRAVMAGLPGSDEIAGRHVCKGRIKAVRTCSHDR